MRSIDRIEIESPFILNSSVAEKYIKDINVYLSLNTFDRPPHPPKDILHSADMLEALYNLFKGKCAYCEQKVSQKYGEIDHFRPMSGAERAKGDVDPKHYVWLALQWENIYLACPACVRSKRNIFPVKKAGSLGANLSTLRRTEGAYLVDPCFDKPDDHFFLDGYGRFIPRTERGETSIDVLNLNRNDLLQERKQIVAKFQNIWRELLHFGENSDINALEIFDSSMPFCGSAIFLWLQVLRRYHISIKGRMNPARINIQELTTIVKQIGELDLAVLDQDRVRYHKSLVYDEYDRSRFNVQPIRSVKVTNFLGIENYQIDFAEPKGKNGNWTAILGENAVGKTCLLKAITLCLLGPVNAQDVVKDARSCLRRGSYEGEVVIRFWDLDEPNSLTFNKSSSVFGGNRSVCVLVLGYGAYRLPARRLLGNHKRSYLYRVHTLFDDRELVNGPLGMVDQLQRDEKKLYNAAGTLKELLTAADADVELVNNSQIIIRADGSTHQLSELSSGYKSIISLAADIMDVMYKVWNGVESGRAVVIVDELDAHLHPAWRMKIVSALRRAFPMVEFIFSTHDPLTLRGVDACEVVVMCRESDGILSTMPYVPPINGLSVDQILTSNVFGLNTTLGPEEDALLTGYYDLLGKDVLSAGDENLLADYRSKLEGSQVLGRTKRERFMYEVIDREIARHDEDASFSEWNKDTIDHLLNIIRETEKR